MTRRGSTPGAVGPGPGRRSVEIMEGPPSCLARRQLLAAAAKVQMATPGAELKFDLHEAVALSLPRNAQRPRRRHRPCWHLWNAHSQPAGESRPGPARRNLQCAALTRSDHDVGSLTSSQHLCKRLEIIDRAQRFDAGARASLRALVGHWQRCGGHTKVLTYELPRRGMPMRDARCDTPVWPQYVVRTDSGNCRIILKQVLTVMQRSLLRKLGVKTL